MTKNFAPTFAPDGMSGGSDRFNSQQHQYITEEQDANQSTESEHAHDYDDGLVHSHNWAVSSPER